MGVYHKYIFVNPKYYMALSRFSIIVAVDNNNGIAKDGCVPWTSMADGIFFRDTTVGRRKNAIIMGRRTYEAIPLKNKPLAERATYVISKTWKQEDHQEVTVCESILEALTMTSNKSGGGYENIFVAGGETIYKAVTTNYLYLCDRVYVTKFKMNYECDQFFDFGAIKDFPYFLEPQLTQDFNRLFFKVDIVHPEYTYLRLISDVLDRGEEKTKSGEGRIKQIFGESIRFCITDRLPVITTRMIDYVEVLNELLMWVSGKTMHPGCENVSVLSAACSSTTTETSVSLDEDNELQQTVIFSKTAVPRPRFSKLPRFCDTDLITKRGLTEKYERGDYGPYEGFMLRHWNSPYENADVDYSTQGEDQIDFLTTNLRQNPLSHKNVASMWSLSHYADQLQHPETLSLQFSVGGPSNKHLDCIVTKRESNVFSQLPYDILKYSLFLAMMAHTCNLQPGNIIFNIGHAYINCVDEQNIKKQCSRTPRPFPIYSFRRSSRIKEISDFTIDNFIIEWYSSWPAISSKAPKQ